MRLRFLLLAAAAAIVPALADDGTAELGAGGIVFGKSADIRMAREDLYVSPDKVRVRFEFQNTGADQDVLIAFPLPDIDLAEGGDFGTLGEDPVNFVGFTAKVDGQPVTFQTEQKAFLKNKDVSAAIRADGIPLNLAVNGANEKLQKLSDGRKKQLAAAGIIDYDGQNAEPLWTVRTRFYWTQHFGAGKTLTITHGYTPVTGGSQYYDNPQAGGVSQEGWVKPYCMDKGTIAKARAMLANPASRPPLPDGPAPGMLVGYITDYVLSTANTWKGPIGLFHLTLDKTDPRALLTLCWKGDLAKTGPSVFEFIAKDFTPTQDIHMAVLK